MTEPFVLTLSCPEQPGIVHAITTILNDNGCDITEHQQFDDPMSGKLFLRTAFNAPCADTADSLQAGFADAASLFDMTWKLDSANQSARILVVVSRYDHCLTDLLYRWRTGSLGGQVAAVVSNHRDLAHFAASAGVPFVHIPVTAETKAAAEQQLLEVIDEQQIELVVLARYMQVLSDDCARLCAAARSTSTTPSCPASRAPSPTTRPTNGASSSSARPRTTSPQNSTKVRSSSRKSFASTTRAPRRT